MAKKTPQKLGIEFQDSVQVAMVKLQSRNPTIVHRLYDTRSAGSYLPGQPGDFICMYDTVCHLIEVKSSEKYPSMAKGRSPVTSLCDADQIAKLRLWHRAGAKTWVIFQSQVDKHLELWQGPHVAKVYVTPKTVLDPERFAIFYPPTKLDQLILDMYSCKTTLF